MPLTRVVRCGQDLQIEFDMQSANIPASERYDVINMVQDASDARNVLGASIEFGHYLSVCPRNGRTLNR